MESTYYVNFIIISGGLDVINSLLEQFLEGRTRDSRIIPAKWSAKLGNVPELILMYLSGAERGVEEAE